MKVAAWASAVLLVFAVPGFVQENNSRGSTSSPTLTVRSTVVLVPTLVKTKKGEVVFSLSAEDFAVTDDGVPQRLTLDTDTDAEPLALAICVETGGAGRNHLGDYDHLDAILTALIGGVEHRVAVVGFDSKPHLLLPFTPETGQASLKLGGLRKGDAGAAILDGVAFAAAQLRAQPSNYRRAILLIGETIDQGSETSLGEALRLISDTNTSLYSFGFSSAKAALSREAAKFGYLHPREPGPANGCFSRDGADEEYDGHYSQQVLDCLSALAPPLRLATMAYLTARNGLRTSTAASLAELTGGEFFRFRNAKELKAGLVSVMHDVLNYYVLSFRPSAPTPGLHALHVETRDRGQLELRSRIEYWIDDDTLQ